MLTSFDEFIEDDTLASRDEQDYRSVYQDLYDKYRHAGADAKIINDDLVFEIELLKQVDINIDYILMLVQKYHNENCQDKVVLADIERAVSGSPSLRNKRDLIEQFIAGLDSSTDVTADWRRYVADVKERELSAIVGEEALEASATEAFMERAFHEGAVSEVGTDIIALMTSKPSRFEPSNAYTEVKQRVIAKLKAFFERFSGLGAW